MGREHSHSHGHEAEVGGTRLLIALVLNLGITAAQIVGGLISGSLSLLADAVHNGSDAAALGVSYGARRVARRKADRTRTFGYHRAELIGAMINLTTLFVIALFLTWQAVSRLLNPPEVGGAVMLVVGAVAFVEDAISAWLLYRGARGSLNIRSAYIHMVGDTLATLGVIVGGVLILLYDIYWVDPLITAAIAVYIFVHSYVEMRRTARILMESAPAGFDFDGMVRAVEAVDGVQDLHHVHLWRLDEERVALEAHVAIAAPSFEMADRLKRQVKELLRRDFGVDHTTLEVECEHCTDPAQPVIAHE